MKTLTEFDGFWLRNAIDKKNQIWRAASPKKSPQNSDQKKTDAEEKPAEAADAVKVEPSAEAEVKATTESAGAEQSEEGAEPQVEASAESAEAKSETESKEGDGEKKEAVEAPAGASEDELKAKLVEELKIKEDRLKYFWDVIEAVGFKTRDLKRVVVCQLEESDKQPEKPKPKKVDTEPRSWLDDDRKNKRRDNKDRRPKKSNPHQAGTVKVVTVGEFAFKLEYLPSLNPKKGKGKGRGRFDKKRGKRRFGKGKGRGPRRDAKGGRDDKGVPGDKPGNRKRRRFNKPGGGKPAALQAKKAESSSAST